MVLLKCPKCGNEGLKFYIKEGYEVCFDIYRSNEKIMCRNCKRIISYSVIPKGENLNKRSKKRD